VQPNLVLPLAAHPVGVCHSAAERRIDQTEFTARRQLRRHADQAPRPAAQGIVLSHNEWCFSKCMFDTPVALILMTAK
jgi:hypothetical protein